MAVKVNPPPQLRIPSQFIRDNETREYVRQIETILFQLWQRTGGESDIIDASLNIANQSTQSYSLWLQQQINGLPEMTMDTTGFTMDSTFWSMDMRTV
jgi:hypothetical protein